jgi:phosphatidylserine decarboxylase
VEVKGLEFSPVELLGGDELAARFQAGAVLNFYLAPPDYHHIHSPVSGRIVKSRYVPGDLWPVNDWALKSIPRLFCKNERVVTFIESPHGLVAVVMVGALNVGRISVTYDSWLTNSGNLPTQLERTYVAEIPVQLGQKLGTFHMGSSVLVLIEKVPAWFPEEAKQFGKVRYGESLRAT